MTAEVFCRYDPIRVHYEIVVRSDLPAGAVGYMHPPTFSSRERHAALPDGLIWREENLDLLNAFAQAAWEHGWRPKGFDTEDVNAMRAHLEDKREEVRWLRERVTA